MGIELVLLGVSAAAAVGSGISGLVRANEAEEAAEKQQQALVRRGLTEAELRREQTRRLLAQQRALAGISGLEESSFFDLFADTAIREERAAQRTFQQFALAGADVARQGELAASGLRAQGAQTILGGVTGFAGGVSTLRRQQQEFDLLRTATQPATR